MILTHAVVAQLQGIRDVCQPALMKDLSIQIETDRQRYSYFAEIDKRTFEAFKLDVSTGASIPLGGDFLVIFEASADYSQFSLKRSQYFKKEGYSESLDRQRRDIRRVTSPIAYKKWAECVSTLAAKQRTIAIWKKHEDENVVAVVIRNYQPVTVKLTSSLLNASVRGQETGKAFRDGRVS